MVKVALIIVGSVAAIYTAIAVVIFVQTLLHGDVGGVRGTTDLVASLIPPLLGAAVAISCFQRAIRKPPPA